MSEEVIEQPQAVTAFLVVIPVSGVSYATNQIKDVAISRSADDADIRRACLEVGADLNARAAAQYLIAAMKKVNEPEVPSERVVKAFKKRQRAK